MVGNRKIDPGKAMKITVSGVAIAKNPETNEEVRDTATLKSIHGLRFDDDLCSNYLGKEPLNQISISGGAIAIVYDEIHNQLRVVSEFWAPRQLSDDEVEALKDDTRGQWSDGIGEGCFDSWCEQKNVFLDLSPLEQLEPGGMAVEQSEDGVPAPRFAHLPKVYWYHNAVDLVRQAVSERADLNATYDGFTTLGLALSKNDPDTAILLIEAGADVNRGVPLSDCMKLKDETAAEKIAGMLLSRGADVNAEDVLGRTPLATAQGREKLVALLRAAGAR
jgi:hypothetical protein